MFMPFLFLFFCFLCVYYALSSAENVRIIINFIRQKHATGKQLTDYTERKKRMLKKSTSSIHNYICPGKTVIILPKKATQSTHSNMSETGKRSNIFLMYLISPVILHPKIRKTALSITLSIRYDTRCYFNVRSKANMRQLNLPHRTDN